MLNTKNSQALDNNWHAQLKQLQSLTGEVFAALELPQDVLSERRHEFESSGYTADVDLLPSHVNTADLQKSIDGFQALLDEINAKEQNECVREAYTARIQELIANNHMILAATKEDAEKFEAENISIYGQPDPQIFSSACAWIRKDAAEAAEQPDLADRANKVLELIPDTGGEPSALIPDEATFHAVRQLHRQKGGYYEQLFGAALPNNLIVTQAEGDIICSRVLENIGSDYGLAFAENGIWAVLQSQKTVVRPPGYSLDVDEFVGIVSHEIGSHLLESVNGARQTLQLLETGMDRYEFGSEGRAFLREQIVYQDEATFLKQASWEYIITLYLAVCLGSGAHLRKYTFSQLYETVYALFSLWRHRRYPNQPNNEQVIRDEAWFLAVRIAKGTRGNGGAYMKDIVYLEGNVNCWRVARDRPELILLGDIGKFDIANPRHIRLLEGLGIVSL